MRRRTGATLFAIEGLGRGGSELQLTRLLEGLAPETPEATLLVLHPGRDELLTRVRSAGVRTVVAAPVAARGPIGAAARLALVAATMARVRPRLIYAWLEEAALLLIPWAILTRTPIVVARRNLAGSRAERRHPVLARIQHWLERRATLVTANSEAVADKAAGSRGIDRRRIRVVPNGHELTEPLALPESEEIVIGYVANFRPGKGHMTMLDALGLLSPELRWRALFAGRGPDAGAFTAEVARRGLGDRVQAGPVDDPRAFWAGCHVAALLSDGEGSPNALIEAALAGRPVIATAVGGIVEIVPEGAGALVPPGDARAAAGALEVLLRADRARLSAMGMVAHRHAVTRFDVSAMVRGHRDVLAEASPTPRRRP